MTGILLRLAGPLQSWGEHSTFSTRDTAPMPTRSALIGMIAAAHGRRRGDPLDDLAALRFTIRADRPGSVTCDFHTVGGGLPTADTVPTADGKRRPGNTATIVSRRYYLTDAAFTVAVTGEPALINQVTDALTRPVWAPYLGRRSCPTGQPFLLKPTEDPVAALDHVPLNRSPRRERDTVDVDFLTEEHPAGTDQAGQLTLNDIPVDLHPHRRRYRSRQVYLTRRTMPAALCAGIGSAYLDALIAYAEGTRP